ncbi:MAG TPA: hydantoinase B/oxoprolinase family protein [Acidimicrobiales bacterium]|nr:hydantoinase B/oxoprolinase family protein [Acidimicrobiales bacterium]
MTADAVTTELIRSKVNSLSEEMLYLLYRSAYSTLMRENRDCSFLATTPSGDLLTEGPHYYRFAIHNLLSRMEPRDGDIFITNHPYESGVQHTPDLLVMVPVFHAGVHIGFSCATAHKSDVGGAVVGSASSQSTELFQEGLLLPIIRFGHFTEDDFELDENVIRIISTNVRNPDLFLGDMRAQIGVTRVGRERLEELAAHYGAEALLEAFEEILNAGERMMRHHLAGWPDGSVTVEGFVDDDGIHRDRPVRFEFVVTKEKDSITFDASGSDDQTRGPVNMQQGYMENAVFGGLLSVTDPSASYNDGMRRPVRVITRLGSVFQPHFPAPVGAATIVSHRVWDMVLEALGHFVPAEAVANGGGSGGTLALLWEGEAQSVTSRAMQYEILGTGLGASASGDGCDGTSASGQNMPLTPIEILETQFPVRIRRFELIEDSGGPGEFRGGMSYRREYECLAPATLNRRADRGKFSARGINGGLPGSLGRLILNAGAPDERELAPAGTYHLERGETFTVIGSGAGGYGHPTARDPEAVRRDVVLGDVSRAAAEEYYGVVVDRGGEVDHEATARRRGVASEDAKR